MKLGDIKAEALKIMFVNAGDDVAADNLIDYVGADTYGYYLVNMTGAINRAFSLLEQRRVLPLRSCDLIAAAGVETPRGVKFDLTVLVPDFYDVSRLVVEDASGYEGAANYRREGDAMIIEGFDTAAMYRLLYLPRVPRVGAATPDDEEVKGVPDHIACLLPYAIKADLFRDDDPDEAERARVRFEESMAALAGEARDSFLGSVHITYGRGMMS